MANKKNQTAISDEAIIAALIQNPTIAQAAAAVGLSPRALYDRMADQAFQTAYNAAKAGILRGAVAALNDKVSDAIAVISEVMYDSETNAGTRLQAAKMILESASKFADRLADADSKFIQSAEMEKW